MTVKEKLIDMLVSRGMFESQAKTVIELAIPEIEKDANEVGSYSIDLDSPEEDYPEALYKAWFKVIIKPIALKWIDENKPHAWFRDIFLPQN